jgi:hypothetical protein
MATSRPRSTRSNAVSSVVASCERRYNLQKMHRPAGEFPATSDDSRPAFFVRVEPERASVHEDVRRSPFSKQVARLSRSS